MRRLVLLHRFLSRQLFYPLVLSSVLATAIWVGRVYFGHTLAYWFMSWNLFLAWVPYLFGLVAAWTHSRYPGRWWLLLLPLGLWLLFFPNAPYIITDLWHLDQSEAAPLWYDIGLFASFALTGVFLGIVSLNTVQGIVASYVGRAGSWLFVLSVTVLSGLGIYLGRFLQLNSWDLFFNPGKIILDVVESLAHPIRNQQAYGVTLMFGGIFFICYLTFTSVQRRERRK